MTQKELMYIEDTLNHYKLLDNIITNAKDNIKKKDLIKFLDEISTKINKSYNNIYNLIKE